MSRLIRVYSDLAVILFVTWWVWFGVEMPKSPSNDMLAQMYLSNILVVPNILGLLATFFYLLFVMNVLIAAPRKDGLFMSTQVVFIAGISMYIAIQFSETFLWPLLARTQPALLFLDGPILGTEAHFFPVLVLAGLLISAGVLLFSRLLSRQFHQPMGITMAYALAFIVFGVGMHPYVRTVGFVVWVPLQVILVRRIQWNFR
ncbi:MAG: hypothetical protein OEV94_05545 [Deltaproteobacteria bacterium]|nr:hypothetical protein [Deltaproteobacteria bacterium]